MNAREAIEHVDEHQWYAYLDFEWDVPDDFYEVQVWRKGDTYFMQLHDEYEPIEGDKELILINMTSYNGKWVLSRPNV